MPDSVAGSTAWEGFRLSKQQEQVLGRAADGLADRTVAGVALAAGADRAVLEAAVKDVVQAHESLRTGYRKVLGENSAVLMVIDDEPRVQVSESSGGDAALSALLRAELHSGGDAASDEASDEASDGASDRASHRASADLLRLILFTHADGHQSLVVSAPLLSMDTASVEVFFRDLSEAYAARTGGAAWQRENILQYADYAQWQSEEGMPTERHSVLAAERQARAGDVPPAFLPLEKRSVETTYDSVEWTVSGQLAEQLRNLGDKTDGGLRTVLLTAWFAALWHATGRPESLAVNAVLTRRPFDEMCASVGRFENPIPLVADVLDETSLADLLATVGRELDTLEQADERAMDPAKQHLRALPGFRFSDVADFTGAQAPDGLAFGDLWLAPADDGRKVALWVQGVDGQLRLAVRHQSGAMADGGAEALAACLRATLTALADDPAAVVAALPMLDDAAARELVAAMNAGHAPAQNAEHWHRQVEQTVRRTPEAIALRLGERTWSYREFDEAANRLAHELIARGVQAGGLVGLCLERSDVALVAMFAIAKAGAGYVPVDPALPEQRRVAIVAGAALTHAVATEQTAADLPADCDVVLIDADLSVCAQRESTAPEVETTDDDPAYVLFTSGSTGTPKGVLVGHGQLAAYLDGVGDRLRLRGPVTAVALGTLGTDLGNTALFPALTSGGELLIVPAELSSDVQAVSELLAQTEYDLIKITPLHMDALLEIADDPRTLMPRQALVVGGEAFGWGPAGLVLDFLGDDCKLFNHYGPTETTVGVLCGRVASTADAKLASTVPIGTPMRHARAYILDPHRRPVPAGVPGELWIGGASVAQGYLTAPEQTAERFVEDPFSDVPGARMYRSGDKARQLPGGDIEFLGRLDRQLKVRGYRVELGEIEAIMRRHPRVSASLVAEKGKVSQAQLVGYLIDTEGTRGSAEWLRDFVAEHLPDFMVPGSFVALDAFPLTSTGKINTLMLPEPGFYGLESASYVEPKTPTEQKVADIMAQLLLLNRVGSEDDFFEIGGHSLLATQLISRLRTEFTVNIKLRNLFEYPVVSELAEFVDGLLASQEEEA